MKLSQQNLGTRVKWMLCLLWGAFCVSAGAAIPMEAGATLLFYGNSTVERLLENGELEARIQLGNPHKKLRVRSLAWTGDEVGHRLRPEGYAQHMKNLLEQWPAQVVVLGYGMNESFAGEAGVQEFGSLYRIHVEQLKKSHPNAVWVFLSPCALEQATPQRQLELAAYSKVIAEIAHEQSGVFIDLLSLGRDAASNGRGPLTSNGIHLNDAGCHLVAQFLAESLCGPLSSEVSEARIREVARAASAKHARVADVVRPKNAVVYFGVRKRPDEYALEMPRFHRMIEMTEDVLHRLVMDPSRSFADFPTPELPPLPEGKGHDDGPRTGVIRSSVEAMAEFKVAEGYAVNLFASEEQFPELRNPVQIAFDARGRLWVVTMPSFPHTVPGRVPEDRILVLEDTDRDGRADKATTFAAGFDALDGIAFHHDGVVVSEQPRLWVMRDTDGDGRADSRRELLRGIDVTDSHHGGMIAADPAAGILFCDGVFHRSQIETPFGVHRGFDSTTYRLETHSGRVGTEWQSITPNPWKITFDRWGNAFQMYGDGLVLDGLALTWTPLGVYHPFAHAKTLGYGKGSAAVSISSANFPAEYQQGMASAALLGNHAVSLTRYQFDRGIAEGSARLDVLSSANAAFRPADLAFGMDGALYVSDFCSAIIGHAQHPMRDPHWDHDHGRIWRIHRTSGPLHSDWPTIEGQSPSALCALLLNPQDLVREHARIELRKHGVAGLAAVDQWIGGMPRDASDFEQAALEVLFVCEGLGQTRPALLMTLLKSNSAMHRAAAVHLMRLQAARIDDLEALAGHALEDSHPRVQMEAVDLIAHLRPQRPSLGHLLHGFHPAHPAVQKMVDDLHWGVHAARGRSVPVLEVDTRSQIQFWEWLPEGGASAVSVNAAEKRAGSADGLYRAVVDSGEARQATLGIKHRFLDVRVNGVQVFSQDSLWSSDHQIPCALRSGPNLIEITLRKTGKGPMPAIHLFDPVGQPLGEARVASNAEQLAELLAAWERCCGVSADLLRVQAVPGKLQFAPARLRVSGGKRLKMRFENPDLMQHNLVIVAPGSAEETGLLADQLATKPDGPRRGFVPESVKVLLASPLLNPGQHADLEWEVPRVPGVYPFLCTFPGHWRVMRGEIVVE
jgi:uncharacterized cupredoxin-like copper-binding protein